MKAVCIEGPGQLRIEEREIPPLEPGMEWVRVSHVGLSGSDVLPLIRPSREVSYPIVPGTAFGGVLLSGPREGQRVVLSPWQRDTGHPGTSLGGSRLQTMGIHLDGGLSQVVRVNGEQIFEAPDKLTEDQMTLVKPLAMALQAIANIEMAQGEWVVIFGMGTVGFFAALLCMYYQARPIVVEPLMSRLKRAGELGVRELIHAASDPVLDLITTFTQGKLAHSVIETSGDPQAVRYAMQAAAPGGRVALMAREAQDATVDIGLMAARSLQVTGVAQAAQRFPTAINLLVSGELDSHRIVDMYASLSTAHEALLRFAERPHEYLYCRMEM